MLCYSENKFLSAYFLAETLIPEKDRERAFFGLAECYLCGNAQRLWELCNSATVRDVSGVETFYLWERLKKLDRFGESVISTDSEVREIISIKGKSVLQADELKFIGAQGATHAEGVDNLVRSANEGVIAAMTTYGFMLAEGAGVKKDLKAAVSYLRRAALWNSVEGILAAIKYDRASATLYVNILCTTLAETPYMGFAASVAEAAGLGFTSDRISHLTEKLFKRGVVTRDKLDYRYFRLLHCSALAFEDKQGLALSATPDVLAYALSLPLNLKGWAAKPVSLCETVVDREGERKQIESGLNGAVRAAMNNYRPMCICGREKVVLGMYAEALKKSLPDCNFVFVDLSNTAPNELEAGYGNILLRRLRENTDNIVVFVAVGTIGAEKLYAAEKFCRSVYRRTYPFCTGYSVNLSTVVPVCLCDEENAAVFKKLCNVIDIEPLSDGERSALVDGVIKRIIKTYGFDGCEMDGDAAKKLKELSIDHAQEFLERAAQMSDGAALAFTKDDIESYLRGGATGNVAGFGRRYS